MLDKLSKLDQLALANKTPVSWLHEICTRNNITPKYDLLQVEGAIHEPIFQYRLTLEYNGTSFEETGTGRSKKEAKHNTARAMLASIEISPHVLFEMGDPAQQEHPEDPRRHVSGGSVEDPDTAGANPVGILQELCMKMKYPPPTYGVDSEEGLPHERLFAMACKVGDQFIQIGKGKSKKLAKRQAAHLMAEYLRAMPKESANSAMYDDDDDRIIDQINALRSSKNDKHGKHGKVKPPQFGSIDNTVQQYLAMTGSVIEKLRDPLFMPDDPMAYVAELGVEQDFEPMYVDFEEKSTADKYQCIVQLTLEPPAVLMGEGLSPQEARVEAAIDVVNFFSKIRMVGSKYVDCT